MKVIEWHGRDQTIVDFYSTCDYKYQPKDSEKILAALDDSNKVVGVVRLSDEKGLMQLRGMQVHISHQGRGVGKEMLKVVEGYIDNQDCFLVGYPHLVRFYGLIGFKTISFAKVPELIKERYINAKKRFPETEFCIMKRQAVDNKNLSGTFSNTTE